MTSDLENGRIKIRVFDGAEIIADGNVNPNLEGISDVVLCRGLLLFVGPREQPFARLGADLDPR